MIDLRRKDLPCELWCGEGEGWLAIQTDYRVWLEFDRSLREDHWHRIASLPTPCPPVQTGYPPRSSFLQAKNATPHMEEATDDGLQTPTLEPILDGSYIYASFLQAYGIDLFANGYALACVLRALGITTARDHDLAHSLVPFLAKEQ